MDKAKQKELYIIFILSAIGIFGLLIRLEFARVGSLWFDEVNGVRIASKSLPVMWDFLKYEFSPPLYYYLLHYWILLFGKSEYYLRLLGVVFGTLTIPLGYFVSNRLFKSRRSAIFTAALIATSPFFIFYSSDARMYPLLVFFGLIQLLAFIKQLDNNSWGWEVVLAIFSILAFYTHYSFGLFLFAELLVLVVVWFKKKSGREQLFKRFFPPFGITALFVAVLFYLLSRYQIQRILTTSLDYTLDSTKYSLVEYVLLAVRSLNFYIGNPSMFYVWFYQLLVVFILVVYELRRKKIDKEIRFKTDILLALFVIPTLMLFFASPTEEIVRYVSLSGLFLLVLLPVAVDRLLIKKRFIYIALLALLLWINTYGELKLYKTKLVDWRYQFKGITHFIDSNFKKGDAVLILEPVYKVLLQTYSQSDNLTYIDYLPSYTDKCTVDDKVLISFGGEGGLINSSNIKSLDHCLKNYNRIWFLYLDDTKDKNGYGFEELLTHYSKIETFRWPTILPQADSQDSGVFVYLFSEDQF